MSNDEIIEMARQAGMVQDGDVWFSANNYEQSDVHTAELKAFAKLVAAKEREACAKLCEETVCTAQDSWDRGVNTACTELARAIRARGEA